jgi:outer membrane autotransporter protein
MLFDVRADYVIPAGRLVVKPEVGFTRVETWRGSVAEAGGSVFALDVNSSRLTASFGDAGLRLESAASTAPLRFWVGAGVREQFDNPIPTATATFTGTTLPLSVAGVNRSKTVGTGEAGFNWRISGPATVFASYHGEFGANGSGNNLTAGVRVSF